MNVKTTLKILKVIVQTQQKMSISQDEAKKIREMGVENTREKIKRLTQLETKEMQNKCQQISVFAC